MILKENNGFSFFYFLLDKNYNKFKILFFYYISLKTIFFKLPYCL